MIAGVLKRPGEPPEPIAVERIEDTFALAGVTDPRSEATLTHDRSTVLVYDDSLGRHAPTERGWEPNIEHPSYRSYLELRGPVLVFGNGEEGWYDSLSVDGQRDEARRLRESE
jgi:hypothetical protein